jgi:hypothetical protein
MRPEIPCERYWKVPGPSTWQQACGFKHGVDYMWRWKVELKPGTNGRLWRWRTRLYCGTPEQDAAWAKRQGLALKSIQTTAWSSMYSVRVLQTALQRVLFATAAARLPRTVIKHGIYGAIGVKNRLFSFMGCYFHWFHLYEVKFPAVCTHRSMVFVHFCYKMVMKSPRSLFERNNYICFAIRYANFRF